MIIDNDNRTLWQRRADRVRFLVWQGRELQEMTDSEIKAAFDGLSREHSISYIWRD